MSLTNIQSGRIRVGDLWFSTVLVAVLAAQFAECILLQRKFMFFTIGDRNGLDLTGLKSLFVFVGLSFSIDVLFVSLIVSAVCVLMRRFCNKSIVAFLSLFFPIAIIWSYAVIEYKVFTYFRDTLDFHLLRALGGGNLGETLSYVSPEIWRVAFPVIVLAVLGGIVLHILKRRPDLMLPSLKMSRISIIVITLACLVFTVGNGLMSRELPKLRSGLDKKLSFFLFSEIADIMTDFDRDGFGLFSSPRDPALFSSQVYPYAPDFPGNGLDENGLAGDLPVNLVDKQDKAGPSKPLVLRPVVLIVLETFRWDVLEATVKGQEVTPNLNRLVAEGISIPVAVSHNPVSEITLQNIFLGSLFSLQSSGSVFSDFNALGYETAIFSAADESYGGTDKIAGLDSVDVFYDARMETEYRMQPGNLPMSRMIASSRVNSKIFDYLENRENSRPLFMYINYQEAHFPYHSPMHEDILNDSPIPRYKMDADNADWLKLTYLNAVANTDRALGELMKRLKEMGTYDDTVFILVGDHGEELFDDGMGYLGHGYALNDMQTRIPFILVHGGIEVVYPIGLNEVRSVLQRTLAVHGNAGQGSIALDKNKRVFQYIGYLKRPRQIGIVGVNGRLIYDFQRQSFLSPENKWFKLSDYPKSNGMYKEAVSLIHRWESYQYNLF